MIYLGYVVKFGTYLVENLPHAWCVPCQQTFGVIISDLAECVVMAELWSQLRI